MKILSWNLHKQEALISWAALMQNFDVGLFQEVDFASNETHGYWIAKGESFDNEGTAIVAKLPLSGVNFVKSPWPDYRAKFWKGKVYKVATIARVDGIEFVSFHGYNGTLQGKDPEKLRDHVERVLIALDREVPAVFSGDFNTWGPAHLKAVASTMHDNGFELAMSAPYDSKKTLDLAFVRGCSVGITKFYKIPGKSDHPFMVFDVKVREQK
jgi:hypothetical protein